MSIYYGINGVIRKAEPVIKVGYHSYSDGKSSASVSVVHPHTGVVGVDGVTRKFLLPTDVIQKIVWQPVKYLLNDTEISASESNDYGTVTIAGNEITVYCDSPNNELDVCGTFFVRFRDGSEYALNYLINESWNRGRETVISSFQIDLSYTLSVQTGYNYPIGINSVWCLGNAIHPDSWSNSSGTYSGSRTVSSFIKNKWGLEVLAGNDTSNWAQTQVTIDRFLLNGISFPVSLEE